MKCIMCNEEGYISSLDDYILCGDHHLEIWDKAHETMKDNVLEVRFA